MNKRILYFTLFFSILSIKLVAQKSIKGKVIDENFIPLPGVQIFNQDTLKIGTTDFDGLFEISVSQQAKRLIFAFPMFEWANILLQPNCDHIELILLNSSTYDFMSSRKVDRQRKKDFDRISELHKQAFDKELFKSHKACFKQEFGPIKPKLDKIAKRSKELTKENKRKFELLKIGDTITIPFNGTFKYDGTERTSLFVYSYLVQGENFDCKIKGVVTEKEKNRKGYFVTYKVTNLDNCEYKSMIYNDRAVEIGQILEQNMKYFKIILE